MINKTAAIVVTYNRKELLLENIQALMKQTVRNKLDIIIIDNASIDGTYESIKRYVDNKEIMYFNTGQNLGGAGGFQYGIKQAYILGYEYFWLMDDDTVPYSNALEELNEASDELMEYGFLSSVSEWIDGSLCNMNIQRTGINSKNLDYGIPFNRIIMATFVSFYFKREVVEKIGLPIKEFVIWSDDLEYSRRISKIYPCYLVTNSRVVHKMKSNNKVGIENETSDRMWRYKLMYRNEVYVYRREGIKGWIYLGLRMLLHSTRIIFKAKNKKKEKLFLIWKSFNEGLHFNPEIENV